MKSIIAAITISHAPVDFKTAMGQTPTAVDYDVHLRALNASAFVGSGGELTFDLVPVQTPDYQQFAISQAYPNADTPITTDAGWMMLRDNAGNSAIVLVDGTTTLSSLAEGINKHGSLEVAVGIATDTMGARLVVAFDSFSLGAFEDGESTYLPAPSVSTSATAVFPERAAAVFPSKEFDALQGRVWPLDIAAAVSSDGAGPLRMTGPMKAEFTESSINGGEELWDLFNMLSAPIYVDGSWTLEPTYIGDGERDEMQYDYIKAWRQANAVWMVQEGDAWVASGGSIEQAQMELGFEMEDYGFVPPPSIELP